MRNTALFLSISALLLGCKGDTGTTDPESATEQELDQVGGNIDAASEENEDVMGDAVEESADANEEAADDLEDQTDDMEDAAEELD